MPKPVSPRDQIQLLKRTCPFFTAHDIAKVTGFRLRDVERALRQLPQDTWDRMPVYSMREISD